MASREYGGGFNDIYADSNDQAVNIKGKKILFKDFENQNTINQLNKLYGSKVVSAAQEAYNKIKAPAIEIKKQSTSTPIPIPTTVPTTISTATPSENKASEIVKQVVATPENKTAQSEWKTNDNKKSEDTLNNYISQYKNNSKDLRAYFSNFTDITGKDISNSSYGDTAAGILGFLSGLGGGPASKADVLSQKAANQALNRTNNNTNTLRNEFEKHVAPLESTMNYLNSQIKNLTRGTGVTDISSIYGYLKSIDPTSVVRPGEVDLLTSANSLFGQLEKAFGAAVSGEQLTPKVRKQLLEATGMVADLAKISRDYYVKRYVNLSDNMGVDPYNVVREPSQPMVDWKAIVDNPENFKGASQKEADKENSTPKEGQTGKNSKGQDIVYINGNWELDKTSK